MPRQSQPAVGAGNESATGPVFQPFPYGAGPDAPAQGYPGFPDPRAQERDNTSLHAMLVGSIVTISIALGLGSSLWINNLSRQSNMRGLAETPLVSKNLPASKSEQTPAAELPPAETVPPMAALDAPRENSAARTMLENDARPAQNNDDDAATPPESAALPAAAIAEPDTQPTPKREASTEQEKAIARQPTAPENPSSASRSKQSTPPLAAATAKKKTVKSRPAGNSKKPAVAEKKRDRIDEIGRLKSQAFSETSKDRMSGSKSRSMPSSDYQYVPPQPSAENPAFSTPASDVAKIRSVRQELAQCERNGNFFVREQCKWRLCDGQWGKNGCPSYETKSAAY